MFEFGVQILKMIILILTFLVTKFKCKFLTTEVEKYQV